MSQPSTPPQISIRKIERLVELLEDAEYDNRSQIEALTTIKFISKNQEIIEKARQTFANKIERFTTPLWIISVAVVGYLALAPIHGWEIALAFTEVLIGGYVLLVGYHQWIRAECNRNVEDAVTRKANLNEVMKQNIDLLYPYVGTAFGSGLQYVPDPVQQSSRIIVDMYVFSELDNLEFVFQKAKFGLIYPEFAFRAVKIFIARAENEKFAQRSSQLVVTGRYNDDFQKLVNQLLSVGFYRRELASAL